MSGLREHKKAATRRAITISAVKLFSEKGYDKTSIEDIARVAGIGKATIYTYFGTKDEIFRSYCDEELEESFGQFNPSYFAEGELIDQLIDFFMIKFSFITKNREFGRQLLREMVFPKDVHEKAKEHDQRYFDILSKLFQAAQQRGQLAQNQDLFLLSIHFYSLYLGVLAGWYTGYIASLDLVEEGMRQLFTQAIDGVGK